MSKSSLESGESCKTGNKARADSGHVELNGGYRLRRSSRKRQSICYNENLYHEGDSVCPPKRLRDSNMSSATKKEHQNAAVTDGVFTRDRPTDSAAAAAMDRYKKEPKQKASASQEERFCSKNCKTGEFELEVKKAVIPCNNETKYRADAASGPNSYIPDPEFNKFGLDEDMPKNIFRANQTWALYALEDGMPRFYALVKKVYTSGFKLKITWLEPNPNDQGEIALCNKELPVACGKYTLGHSEEITNHLMFSHQMHFRRGRGRNSFLVYPRKGETWALYHNWDIGWSCEPEKHVPNKFEYVEVLQDFKQNVGIEVAYLGKAKGFVSLFKQTEMRGVVSFRVPPNELYRFSNQIPSVKLTGDERDGVPKGSFEFDIAALPHEC
ncbi:hypothetical protein L3X38_035606 [Prunus dulcis]|uniref:DUF3444 domain-containing protein n=1 Tax=Prunus dulcis TaxID=3755 RepID=A0AAD4VLR9_PRUDU|nr:hypothetical protein L3X38_035606 [Prunus dulcis]